jgi:hypothetical protein
MIESREVKTGNHAQNATCRYMMDTRTRSSVKGISCSQAVDDVPDRAQLVLAADAIVSSPELTDEEQVHFLTGLILKKCEAAS